MTNFIERPFLKDKCENCTNHYLLDNDESRCRKIKVGQSDAMCVQVVRCYCFKEKGGEPICDYTNTDWNDCCECSAKDYCDKYNERSEIIGELLGDVTGETKNKKQ